jgi:hypothetical protein
MIFSKLPLLLGLLQLSWVGGVLVLWPIATAVAAPLMQPNVSPVPGSVDIHTKTAVLSHGNKRNAFPDSKEAIIRYPVAVGLKDTIALRNVQAAISLKQVLGQSLAEMQQEFQENRWLSEVDYTVNYNRNGILDLTVSVAGVGAYPDGFEKYVSVSLKTGRRLNALDLFKANALDAIAQTVNQLLQQSIQQTKTALLQQEPDIGTDLFANHRFQRNNLENFTIGDHGITFHYDFGFPHVVKAAEPPGDYLVPYNQLRPHLRPDGALGFYVQSSNLQ